MTLFKKRDGAITIFLCIITAFCLVFAQVIVEMARARVATTEIRNNMDLAATSTLTNYSQILKDMYGLMALSENDSDKLAEEFSHYFERTLDVNGLEEEKTSADKVWDKIDEFSNKDKKNYKNIYDFKAEETKVTPLYNLSEYEVLRAQILDNMKFRGPKQLAEGILDKITSLKNLNKQTEILTKKIEVEAELDKVRADQAKASQNVTSVNSFGTDFDIAEVYEASIPDIIQKISLQKENIKLKVQLDEKQKEFDQIGAQIADANRTLDSQKIQLEAAKKVALPPTPTPVSVPTPTPTPTPAATAKPTPTPTPIPVPANITALENQIAQGESNFRELNGKKNAVGMELNNIKVKIEMNDALIKSQNDKLIAAKSKILGKVDWSLQKCDESTTNFNSIITNGQTAKNKIDDLNNNVIKNDTTDFANSVKFDMTSKKETVNDVKMTDYLKTIMDNKKILEYIKNNLINVSFDKINLESFEAVAQIDPQPDVFQVRIKTQIDAVKTQLGTYNGFMNKDKGKVEIQYYVKNDYVETPGNIPKDETNILTELKNVLGSMVGGPTVSDKAISSPKLIEVPTKTAIFEQDKKEMDSFKKYLTNPTGAASENNEKSADPPDATKDADFSQAVTFATTAMSYVTKLTTMLTKGLVELRDELYIDEYAMGNFTNVTTAQKVTKGEKTYNIQGYPFKDLVDQKNLVSNGTNLFKDAEIEYVLWGKDNEKANLSLVRTELLLVRFVLNSIAIWTDPTKVEAALAAATVITAWIGSIGAPLVQVLILLAWSFAEAFIDTNLLMNNESVPIFKLKGTWVLEIGETAGAKFGSTIKDKVREQVSKIGTSAAKELTKEAIDYTKDGFSENVIAQMKLRMIDYCNNVVEQSVNAAFLPIERQLGSANSQVNNALNVMDKGYSDMLDATDNEIGKVIADIQKETTTVITSEIKGYSDKFKDELPALSELDQYYGEKIQNAANDMVRKEWETVYSKARRDFFEGGTEIVKNGVKKGMGGISIKLKEAKDLLKEKIKSSVKYEEYLEKIKKQLDEKADLFADKAKEKAGKYITDMGGKSTQGGFEKTNLKAAFLSANYEDYLRIFLLLVNSKDKVSRIGNLVEMNVKARGKKENFKLSECNTFIRVESKVSMKYLFMTSKLIPEGFRFNEGSRKQISVVLYKGYN